MTMNANSRPENQSAPADDQVPKPYCAVGAGCLTSYLWKTGDDASGWRYRFNVFRLGAKRGRVSQWFQPSDLMHLVKLVQVMASVIADDGYLNAAQRNDLRRLATDLDELIMQAAKSARHRRGASNSEPLSSPSQSKDCLNGNETDT
jgi:hypothetical protein